MRGSRKNVSMMAVVLVGTILLDPAFGQSSNSAAKTGKGPQAGAATLSKRSVAKEGVNIPEKSPLKARYSADFRNSYFDHDKLVPFGFETLYGLGLLRPEVRGLRIVIPYHQGDRKPSVGFLPMFNKIIGDFEITATYELLTAERPKIGVGAGADLYILAEKTLHGASLRRCINPEGKQVYFVHHTIREDGKLVPHHCFFPTEARMGKLRFVRTGSKLQYLVAENEGGPFRKLHEVEFGAGPIGLVRVRATTDGSRTSVETLWQDLSIRAQELQAADIPLFRKRPPTKPTE